MSLERILKALESLGLSQIDAQIYIHLATEGPAKARNIFNSLQINRRQVYRSLKRLRSKGITIIDDGLPFEFTALPFERVLELIMEVKREAAKVLQASKEELVSDFRAMEKKSNYRS